MEKRTPLLIANILRFIGIMGFGPLLQFYMKDIGTSLFLISIFSSIQGTITTFMAPVWGAVSDIIPSKKLILAMSVTIGGIVSIFYYFADNVYEIYSVGIIYTFFVCGFDPVSMAMSANNSLLKGTSAPRELSFLNISNSIGMLSSRILLSALLLLSSSKSLILLMSAILISAFIPVLMIREEKNILKYRRKATNFIEMVFPALKDPEPLKRNGMWALYIASFLRQAGTAGAMGLAAVFIRDVVGLNESLTVILAAINPAVQIPSNYFFGRVAEKIHPKFIAILGMFFSILNLVFMGFARNYIMVILSYVALGFGFGAFITGVTSYISMYSPIYRRGEMLGFLSSARAFGRIIGPLVAGVVSVLSFRAVFFILAIMMSLSIPIMFKFTVTELPKD
ncbi:MAG TPA: MFS transporter [Thermotogaceae bacterium]|nr:MFS transporter [Thermotogota bacterium]HEW91148.1 MFS transporter [Thermotogaceae bacterium]